MRTLKFFSIHSKNSVKPAEKRRELIVGRLNTAGEFSLPVKRRLFSDSSSEMVN